MTAFQSFGLTEKEGFEPSLQSSGSTEPKDCPRPEKERELWVPAHRVRDILRQHTGSLEAREPAVKRRYSAIVNGHQEWVSLNVVDKLFCALDLTEWLHYRLEDGGLADIYEDGKQYGGPPRNPPRYRSKRERVEARRESWRQYGERRNQPVPLECPSCRGVRMVGARYAAKNQHRLCMDCHVVIRRQEQLRRAA